jgi:hypothetical protein
MYSVFYMVFCIDVTYDYLLKYQLLLNVNV